jgi:uncharacterized repeat protein (TIGR03803 family)
MELVERRRFLSSAVTDLVSFSSRTGTDPSNLVIDGANNLYGTTVTGPGDSNSATVFEVASGTHQAKTLATFQGAGGGISSLLCDPAGDLFGALSYGSGTSAVSKLFEIAATSHTPDTLATFDAATGLQPYGLQEDSAGDLFGATRTGGSDGAGTIFELPAQTGSLTVLVNLSATNANPSVGDLFADSGGNLFLSMPSGAGSAVSEIGAGTHSVRTLATFTEGGTAASLSEDAAGDLTGITRDAVFKIAAGTLALSTRDASQLVPNMLPDTAGNYFGAGFQDGSNLAVIAELPAGAYAQTVVSAFNIGNYTIQGELLVADAAGDLYGTIPTGDGSIFVVTSAGYVPASDSRPFIIAQPTAEASVAHHTVSFTAAAGSYPNPAVQWQMSDDSGSTFRDIIGNASASTTTLTLAGLSASQNGTEYRAVFANSLGSVASNPATLNVVPALTIVSRVHASPNVVASTSTVLTTLASTARRQSGLTYRWSVVASPPGAPKPTFSANGNANAMRAVATFHKAGYYRFRCSISDGKGDSAASDVSVEVKQTATSLRLSPHNAAVPLGHSITIQAKEYDQFGHPLADQTAPAFAVVSGNDTINPTTGVFTADTFGSALIQVEDADLSATLGLQVIA